MRGASGARNQELAGHQDLSTTQRYMHLSPAAIEGAIRLLEMEGRTGSLWAFTRWGAPRASLNMISVLRPCSLLSDSYAHPDTMNGTFRVH